MALISSWSSQWWSFLFSYCGLLITGSDCPKTEWVRVSEYFNLRQSGIVEMLETNTHFSPLFLYVCLRTHLFLFLVLVCLPPYREKGIPNYNYKKGKLTFVKAKLLRPEPEEPMVRTVRGSQRGGEMGLGGGGTEGGGG